MTETFILDHVGELAFTLLGAAVGFLWKKLMDMVKEQKYLHDGVLAMLHDRLYLICTHYIKMGYIDTDGLDNVGVIYRAYHGLKGNGTGTGRERTCTRGSVLFPSRRETSRCPSSLKNQNGGCNEQV